MLRGVAPYVPGKIMIHYRYHGAPAGLRLGATRVYGLLGSAYLFGQTPVPISLRSKKVGPCKTPNTYMALICKANGRSKCGRLPFIPRVNIVYYLHYRAA